MTSRDISLAPRAENTRDAHPILLPIRFSLAEIKQHYVDSMSEVQAQLVIADDLWDAENETACKTIWRSQIVLAEGLLDFYIHEISKYCLVKIFSGSWEKTERYYSFQISMEQVENAVAAPESTDWFFDYLNERFSRDVFLSYESMKNQLNLIGIPFQDVMVRAFPENKIQESVSKGKQVIMSLFQRRNEIAHQNDRSHASAEQTDISKDFVEDYIEKIQSIVDAIQKIAEEKDT